MVRKIQVIVAAAAVLIIAGTSSAQDAGSVKFETGLDVLSARDTGEIAFYGGGFQGNHMVAFRFGARDETAAVPCSVGVMYEFVGHRNAMAFLKPMAGASFSRIFSCATDTDVVARPSPAIHGAIALSGGVRLDIFRGRHLGGSLKVQWYAERARAHERAADLMSNGLAVGMTIYGR